MSFDKKAYQREYMAKKRREKKLTAVPVLADSCGARPPEQDATGEARESTSKLKLAEETRTAIEETTRGGSQPSIPEREWRYACERADRAKRYAEAMPQFVKPSEVKYQDSMWQWENEVRGRFGGIIGGSLSGSRGPHAGN